jgi:hypothetical protein
MFFFYEILWKKILSRNFDLSESWLTKGMGQNNIFILKKVNLYW